MYIQLFLLFLVFPLSLAANHWAVASDQPEASAVGAEILRAGGNAADAAAATALALGVINTASSGIGGGGFALVYDAKSKKTTVLDFRETGPAKISPALFTRNGKIAPQLSREGGLAIGVPGEVAGLYELVTQFGSLSWAQVVSPSIVLARDGYKLSPFAQLASHLTQFHVGILQRSGKRETRHRPRLANALAWIAVKGPAGFYSSRVAKDIADSLGKSGGVLTENDLKNYRVLRRRPIELQWNGYRIATMPLPSSGGIVMLEILGILDRLPRPLTSYKNRPHEFAHVFVEAMKHGFADRAMYLGDASQSQIANRLLAPKRLQKLAKRIRKKTRPSQKYGGGLGARTTVPAKDDQGTSHLCVIDQFGNAVALTTTVNGYFGSRVTTKQSGIIMNNQMDDFALTAGGTNMFGLVQSQANLVGPGKRPLSSMSPTLVFKDDQVVGCVGGSGGPRIISNTVQTLIRAFAFQWNASDAVNAPRLHHQWKPNKLVVESSNLHKALEELDDDNASPRRWSQKQLLAKDALSKTLQKRGHVILEKKSPTAVQLIVRNPDGTLTAVSDNRKGGPLGGIASQVSPSAP